jgi:predicted nucleotidyltransferase
MSEKSIHIKSLPLFLSNRQEEITSICKTHKVRYLYAIGSVLRPLDFRKDSDVDLVFAFLEAEITDKDYNPNLWSF